MNNNLPTEFGQIPSSEDYQKVNESPQGKTGEPETFTTKAKGTIDNAAETVQKTLLLHPIEFFTAVSLVGYVLIGYSGNLSDWGDFARYIIFLGSLFIIYFASKYINEKIKKQNGA